MGRLTKRQLEVVRNIMRALVYGLSALIILGVLFGCAESLPERAERVADKTTTTLHEMGPNIITIPPPDGQYYHTPEILPDPSVNYLSNYTVEGFNYLSNYTVEGSFPYHRACIGLSCITCTEVCNPDGCFEQCTPPPPVKWEITGSNDGIMGSNIITNCSIGGDTIVLDHHERSTINLVGDSTIIRRPTLGSYDICMNAVKFWCRSPRERKIQRHVGTDVATCVANNARQCSDCALVMSLMPRRLDPDYGDCREYLNGSVFKTRKTKWMHGITVLNTHGEKLEW